MSFHNKEEFLTEVLNQVKFKYDRYDIRMELEAHIQDKIEYYSELGYDMNKAEELSVNDMGDAKEIGKELNKQHNPFIGWVWRITNILLVLSVIISIFVTGFLFIYKYYDTRLWGTGWGYGTMGEISDNLGNTYFNGSGQGSGGIIARHRSTYENFSKDADTLIITYDYYNRYY